MKVKETYRVRVIKDYLVFCSGHFISYHGNECERLHGHNYRAGVELVAPLDENHYVFDFIALKNLLRELIDELDHRMLLPLQNPLIRVEQNSESVQVRFAHKYWQFPREDCVLLPIINTTAEELAAYLANRLLGKLKEKYSFCPEYLQLEVEESFGQIAYYEWRIDR